MKTVEEILSALIEKAQREAAAGRAHAAVIREKIGEVTNEGAINHRQRSLAETEAGAAEKEHEARVLTDLLALHKGAA